MLFFRLLAHGPLFCQVAAGQESQRNRLEELGPDFAIICSLNLFRFLDRGTNGSNKTSQFDIDWLRFLLQSVQKLFVSFKSDTFTFNSCAFLEFEIKIFWGKSVDKILASECLLVLGCGP